MIDIHSHILYGLDDGAKDLNDSLEMAKAAVDEGITTIIATPHFNEKYVNHKQEIINKVARLNEVIQEKQIPLTILPGQEPRIYGDLLEDYNNGQVLTLNNAGKFMLIELPSNHVPRYTEKLLFDLQLNGLTPIIVHPERNQEIIENPDKLYQFVKKGACTQVTAASLAGYFGKKIKKFSLQMIEANLTHFIASDAHNLTGRSFKMREAFGVVEKEFGLGAVYLFQENAELLLEDKTIIKEAPEQIKRRKILGIF